MREAFRLLEELMARPETAAATLAALRAIRDAYRHPVGSEVNESRQPQGRTDADDD